jgi:hypothetical protein
MMKRMFGLFGESAAANAPPAAKETANPAADPTKERRLTVDDGRLGTFNDLL